MNARHCVTSGFATVRFCVVILVLCASVCLAVSCPSNKDKVENAGEQAAATAPKPAPQSPVGKQPDAAASASEAPSGGGNGLAADITHNLPTQATKMLILDDPLGLGFGFRSDFKAVARRLFPGENPAQFLSEEDGTWHIYASSVDKRKLDKTTDTRNMLRITGKIGLSKKPVTEMAVLIDPDSDKDRGSFTFLGTITPRSTFAGVRAILGEGWSQVGQPEGAILYSFPINISPPDEKGRTHLIVVKLFINADGLIRNITLDGST